MVAIPVSAGRHQSSMCKSRRMLSSCRWHSVCLLPSWLSNLNQIERPQLRSVVNNQRRHQSQQRNYTNSLILWWNHYFDLGSLGNVPQNKNNKYSIYFVLVQSQEYIIFSIVLHSWEWTSHSYLELCGKLSSDPLSYDLWNWPSRIITIIPVFYKFCQGCLFCFFVLASFFRILLIFSSH